MSRRGTIRILPPVLLALAAAPGLSAQRPDDNERLTRWEAVVDRASSIAELDRLADSARGGRDERALGWIRGAVVKRRLGEVTENRRYFDEALEEFWAVVVERQRWPWGWYGLGRTKLAMAARRLVPYTDEHQPAGSTYEREAGVALTRALEADSTFAPARRALSGAVEPGATITPGALLAMAELRRDTGDLDSTIALLDRYLRAAGDSGVGLLEIARARFGLGNDSAGAAAYSAATARIRTAEARRRLRDDLAWLMDSTELAAFDATPGPSLAASVGAFWEERDVRDLRRPGERLAEHYHRLAYAERNFARVSDRQRHTRNQRFRTHQTRLDDRAVIYIRHGPPDERAAFASPFATAEEVAQQDPGTSGGPPSKPSDRTPAVPPNISWKYRRPQGNLIVHFVAEHGSDYRLIESLLDVFSTDTVLALQMRERPGPAQIQLPAYAADRFARALVRSRADLDPVYTRLANGPAIQGSANLQIERAEGQRSLAVGTTTDSYVHDFDAEIEPIVEAYGVPLERGGRVLVVIGVPVRGAGESAASRPMGVRVVVSTEGDRRLLQADTVLALRPVTATGRTVLAGYLDVPAPPGRHRLRALLTDPASGAGAAAPVQPVLLPAASDSVPAIGDLILGVPGALDWSGPDGPTPLNPAGRFRPGSAATLSYAVSGLVPETVYQTTIEIRAGSEGGGRRSTSTFAMKAEGSRHAVHRGIELRGIGAGSYVLVVTVRGPAGSVSSSRPFLIR